MQKKVLKWLCYIIGYVFITTGIVKLLVPEFKDVFMNLGFPFPSTSLFIVAIIEIICGTFIVIRLYLKYAIMPLIVIMIGALYTTKIPVLLEQGIVSFIFDSRLDIVMLSLLLLTWKLYVPIEKNKAI